MDDNSSLEAINKAGGIRRLWQTMGAMKLAEALSRSLASQTLHALEQLRDDKEYLREPGYETFRDFLDHHPDSVMSHDTFRRRINLLQSEGDVTFDLLNSLNVPLSQRKLLAGQIEVAENEIKIGDDTVRLDDGPRIIELVSKLHSKNQELQRTNERKDKKLLQGEKDFEALKRRAIIANPDGTETGQAVLTLAGAFKLLEDKLGAATDEEKAALRDPIFQLLSTKQIDLSVALGVIAREEVPANLQDSIDDEDARLIEEL